MLDFRTSSCYSRKKLDASSFRRKTIRPPEVAAEEWAQISSTYYDQLVLFFSHILLISRGIDNCAIAKWAEHACNGFATQHPDDFVHIGWMFAG